MKTRLSSLLMLFLFLVCAVLRAHSTSPTVDPIDLQMLANQNGAMYKVANTQVLKSPFGDGLLIITTDQGSDMVKDMYFLQGATGSNQNLLNAELVLSDGSIIIRNPANAKIYLYHTLHETSLHEKIPPAQAFSINVGFGLVKYFNLNQHFNIPNIASLLQSNTIQGTVIILSMMGGGSTGDPATDGGPTCLAGGCGSNSCSIDGSISAVGVSCTVSCNSGYYACCGAVALTANQCGCRANSECSGH